MKILLSREGVFPIADKRRNSSTATGHGVSGTIQGEGKLCGTTAIFVRLQGCNLRCRWMKNSDAITCDTAHTWCGGGTPHDTTDVATTILQNAGAIRHVVITGGEPLLQPEATAELIRLLHDGGMHVTVETNGTIINDEIASAADLLSISPKLSASGISHDMKTKSAIATAHMASTSTKSGKDIQIKFVISDMAEEEEIKRDFSSTLKTVAPSDIIAMPLGASKEQLATASYTAVEMALKNGWRYGPRLHITLFGNKEGC